MSWNVIHTSYAVNQTNILFLECVPRCELIKMEANVVPTQYNRCVCDLIVENGELENLSNQELKCTPNYRSVLNANPNNLIFLRSLKFRDRDTGAVVLHKAVVGICNGLSMFCFFDYEKFGTFQILENTSINHSLMLKSKSSVWQGIYFILDDIISEETDSTTWHHV